MTKPYGQPLRIRTAFGTDIETQCETMRSGNTAVFCLIGAKGSETRLHRLNGVIDALPYPIALEEFQSGGTTTNPRLLFLNKAFQKQLGYTTSDCPRLADLLRHLYPDQTYRMKIYREWLLACEIHAKGKPIPPVEAKVMTRSGHLHHVLIHTSPLPILGVRMVALMDITPQKRLIEALRRENLAAENQRVVLRQRLRSSLTAASVAHEIDTALGAILLQAKSSLKTAMKTPEKNLLHITAMQNILSQAEGINKTIDRIRALISSIHTHHKKLDLRAVVQSAILSLKDRIQNHRIRMVVRYREKRLKMVGDETQVYLIVLNLLRNAVDALSSTKGPRRMIRLGITRKSRAFFIVVENSRGHPQRKPCQDTTHVSTRKNGMGLGLFLVRSAVENHHGQICFKISSLGGWKVSVCLPITPPLSKMEFLSP